MLERCKILVGLVAVAMAFAGVGCASVTGSGTARTLPKGETEVATGLELGLGLPKISPTYHLPLPWPQLVASARHGFTDHIDAGIRAWGFGVKGLYTLGGEFDTKIALRKAPSREKGLDVAFAPAASYHQVNFGRAPNHSAIVQLPVLIGYNLPGETQAIVGPRIGYQGVFSAGQHPVHLVAFGSSFGASVQINDSISMVPEFVLLWSPVSFNGTLDDPSRRGLAIMQFGLGFRFDV